MAERDRNSPSIAPRYDIIRTRSRKIGFPNGRSGLSVNSIADDRVSGSRGRLSTDSRMTLRSASEYSLDSMFWTYLVMTLAVI